MTLGLRSAGCVRRRTRGSDGRRWTRGSGRGRAEKEGDGIHGGGRSQLSVKAYNPPAIFRREGTKPCARVLWQGGEEALGNVVGDCAEDVAAGGVVRSEPKCKSHVTPHLPSDVRVLAEGDEHLRGWKAENERVEDSGLTDMGEDVGILCEVEGPKRDRTT